MTTALNPPIVWKRSVDDTRIFMKTAVLDSRSFQQYVQFTVKEKKGVLSLLDTQLNRGQDGTLDITVFRRTTQTLQFESHHPTHIKRGVVRSLFNRAQAVTLKEENVQEAEHLEEVLQENGYPIPFYPEIPGETTTTRWRGAVPQSHRGDPVCSGGE